MKPLTALEETVMLAIYRLGDQAYSVTIHQEIAGMTGKDIIVGTLFNTLKQLNSKGMLNKRKGRPIHDSGSKSVMFYTISQDGLQALEETRAMSSKMWDGIPETLI